MRTMRSTSTPSRHVRRAAPRRCSRPWRRASVRHDTRRPGARAGRARDQRLARRRGGRRVPRELAVRSRAGEAGIAPRRAARRRRAERARAARSAWDALFEGFVERRTERLRLRPTVLGGAARPRRPLRPFRPLWTGARSSAPGSRSSGWTPSRSRREGAARDIRRRVSRSRPAAIATTTASTPSTALRATTTSSSSVCGRGRRARLGSGKGELAYDLVARGVRRGRGRPRSAPCRVRSRALRRTSVSSSRGDALETSRRALRRGRHCRTCSSTWRHAWHCWSASSGRRARPAASASVYARDWTIPLSGGRASLYWDADHERVRRQLFEGSSARPDWTSPSLS